MEPTLKRLDDHLQAIRPDYYAQLRAGLDPAAVDALAAHYRIALPDDLRQLYLWKDGQDGIEAFVNNSMFLPLSEALRSAAELTEMIGSDFEIEHWWHAGWIPVFHNGGGDHVCYDTVGVFTGQAGQIVEFWHADDDRTVIDPDLTSFLDRVDAYYTTTGPTDVDECYDITDVASIPGFPQHFVVDQPLGL